MMGPGRGKPGFDRIRARLRRELLMMGRFGVVGILATVVHVLVVWLLIEAAQFPVLVANLIALLTGFLVSFTGNYIWTFSSPGCPKTAMLRFFLISSFAFSVNMLLLALLTRIAWLEPAVAAISAVAVIPLITYSAGRLWGFRVEPRPAAGPR